jgi:hypothetical protein
MDSSRPFVPSFIKKIDRKLLLNSPSVWSTRTHLVLFFGFLFAALLTLFCAFMFKDARQDSSVYIVTGFVALISFIGFVFWLIYLLRFNVFKRYGNWVKGDGIRTYLLFFVNALVLVAIPFIPLLVETYMANRQFTSAEMVKDVNKLNLSLNKICYNKLPTKFKQTIVMGVVGRYELNENDYSNDTSLVWRSGYNDRTVVTADAVKSPTAESMGEDIVNDDNTNYVNKTHINIKDFALEMQKADSIKILNDTTFISYEYPDFEYARAYNFNSNDDMAILGSKEIYNIAIKNYVKPDENLLTQQVKTLVSKYSFKSRYDYENYNIDIEKESYSEFIKRTYKINTFNESINQILRKKYLLDKEWNVFLITIYYITLVLSLLVFIYRQSTTKTFFLTALAAVVIVIATALLGSFFNFKEESIFFIMLLYFGCFALVGLSARVSTKRTLLKGIGLNLFLFCLPIVPLIIVAYYFRITYYNYNLYRERTIFINVELYYFYAEVIGFLLLLILIEPLFRKLFRAWYAAAED